jgi:hypothetical protein
MVISVLMSIYAQEEYCTRVVSSVLGKLCSGCWFNPDLHIFTDLMMFIIGKMIFIITLIFLFKNLEQFWLFCGHGPRKRSYAGFVSFLYHNWV